MLFPYTGFRGIKPNVFSVSGDRNYIIEYWRKIGCCILFFQVFWSRINHVCRILSASIFLEHPLPLGFYSPLRFPLDSDFHRDMHPERLMRRFTFLLPVFLKSFCTLTELCLGVNVSQMGGVIRVSCFWRLLLLSPLWNTPSSSSSSFFSVLTPPLL